MVNDPAREAAASIRGYWAQIWRSILAWMDLGEAEFLYLEGAEDFDRVSGLTAETIQVKDVTGNVTLRSSDVIEAIDNAWAHRQRNPRHTIKFRFLTTGGIGVEHGAPFGAGIGGLRLWRDCRLSDDAASRERSARAIADFLLTEGKVSMAVQAHLRGSSDAQIWQQLIAPIEWDMDAEEAPEIIREIKDRLVIMGQPVGVAPDKAEEVAEHLYATAYATATRQRDRSLTRADLLRLFHDRTHVSLPAAAANALFAAIPQRLVPAGLLPVAVGGKRLAVGRPPPLPARYYARQSVLAEITTRLSSHPVLLLQGGTGVGKSIAAIGHITVGTSSWGWVDLRGLSAAAVTDMLDRTVTEILAEDGLTHIVLDDIELPPDSRPLETPLAWIKIILGERGGNLLITSTVKLPQRLLLALNLPASATLAMPAFSRDEIVAFLIARGCPEPQAPTLAAFVELHTSGHAQLVHARVATLEAESFPTPDLQSVMLTPSDVVEARSEARRLITALDSSTRELVYRLSLTMQAMPRRQVFAIAGQSPPIAEPGLAFDKLVGPWLETVAEGLYRVSPLLRGVGPEVQGEAWATAMHRDIARALLGFRTLSPTDVSTILFHAIAAQDWPAIAHLSFGIVRSDNDTWQALAQSADWFVLVGTGEAKRPEADAFSLFFIRLFQFRLAAANHDEDAAASIIACVDEELGATVAGTQLRLARHLFLGQVLLRSEVNLPIARLVSMGLEYIRLSDELNDVLAEVHTAEFDQAMTGPDGTPDLATVGGSALVPHLTNRLNLVELLEACEPVPDDARRLLWFIGGRESIAQHIFDRVWLAEVKLAVPDWLACREVLERAYALGRRCALPGLTQGAARAIARLVDENLNDPEQALRLADKMAGEIGRSPGQEDALATILMRKGDPADALAIWQELLPRWTPQDEFDLQQTFSHRLAAIAAARLGKWTESADWLRSARALADEVNQATYCAGLLVDEGFARWMGGDNGGALECLTRGLTAIDWLPPDDADEGAYLLRKRAGHTMMWMAGTAAGTAPTEFSEPPPACCSSLEPVKQASAPSTPSDAMWTHVLQFEFAAKLGDEQFRAHEGQLKSSRYGIMRFAVDRLRLHRRLSDLAFEDFVEVVGDYTDSFAFCRQYYKEGGLDPADPLPTDATAPDRGQSDSEVVLSMMLNAIIALTARAALTQKEIDRWETGAANAGLSDIVAPWLAFVTALFIDNTMDAQVAMRDQSLPWAWQAAASIRLAIDNATRPAELLAVHQYWTSVLPNAGTGLYALDEIERLVTGAWRRLAEQGFLLRAPAVTAPALLQACASPSGGWRKIGEVLCAACDAVPAAVPNEFRERFRQIT
ncbi:hypothetical protein [Bradyrhizobium genosp. A]|uniref:tetratricopeptide repeat protein n=1 Tax=Bradyrhizobium genosp. A TaxID=83626 RepID=UPI003CEEB1B5